MARDDPGAGFPVGAHHDGELLRFRCLVCFPCAEMGWECEVRVADATMRVALQWGYDADVIRFFGPVGQANVQDHAKGLNRDLVQERFEEYQVGGSDAAVLHIPPFGLRGRLKRCRCTGRLYSSRTAWEGS